MNMLKNAAMRAQQAVTETVEAGANIASEAKKSTSDTVDQIGDALDQAHQSVSGFFRSSTQGLLDSVTGAASSAADGITDAGNAVALTVESGARRVVDSAMDAKDLTIIGAAGLVGDTWSKAAGVLKFPFLGEIVGIAVGVGLMPIPVGIGLGLLMLIDSQIEGKQAQIQAHADQSIKRRNKERVLEMMNKYGEIPETAIIETKMLKVSINSSKGTISGVVKSGDFKGKKLEELDHHGFFMLIQSCGDDEESRQVLESLERIRLKNVQGAIS